MERRGKVELFEQIRREYEFGVGTVKEGRAQAGSRSPVGAPGLGRGPAARAQAELTRAANGRTADSLYRRDPGSRPQRSA